MPRNADAGLSNNNVALRFCIRNPYFASVLDEFAYIARYINHEDLYYEGVDIECGLIDYVQVHITYENGLLCVRTSAEVDIYLEGNVLASAVHIETRGLCAFVAGPVLNDNMSIWVDAPVIVVDRAIPKANFIAFLTDQYPESTIHIKQSVAVRDLILQTNQLVLRNTLHAVNYILESKLLHITSTGKLSLCNVEQQQSLVHSNKSVQSLESNVPIANSQFYELHHDEIKAIQNSELVAEEIIQEGDIDFRNGCDLVLMSTDIKRKPELAQKGKLYLAPDGTYVFRFNDVVNTGSVLHGDFSDNTIDLTNVETKIFDLSFRNKIINITSKRGHTLRNTTLSKLKAVKFMSGSKSNLIGINVTSDEIEMADSAIITGSNASFNTSGNVRVNCKIVVDGLSFNAFDIDIPAHGVLDGQTSLQVKNQHSFTVAGKATALHTIVDGEQSLVAFGGAIIGKHNLDMRTAFSAVICGGRISGHNVVHKSGVMLNIFGITNAYYGTFDSLSGFEFGNVHTPYVDAPNSAAAAYDLIAKKLNDIQTAIPKSKQDIYNLAPGNCEEAWHMLSAKFGVIRVLLASASLPLAAGATLTYQSIALILQLIRLQNALRASSNKSLSEHTTQEVLLTLLELKGLVASGKAFVNNVQQVRTLHAATQQQPASEEKATPQEPVTESVPAPIIAPSVSASVKQTATALAANLAPLWAPSLQNDSILNVSAPMLSTAWTESRQNLFSLRGGVTAAWNQYELTAFDQVDYSRRYSNTLLLNAGNRYQYGKAYTNHLSIFANNAYIPKGGVLWSAKSTSGVIEGEFTSDGEMQLRNGEVKVGGNTHLTPTATTELDNVALQMKGGFLQEGKMTLQNAPIYTQESAVFTETSHFQANDSAMQVQGNLTNAGEMKVQNASALVGGNTHLTPTATTELDNVALQMKGGFLQEGKMTLEKVAMHGAADALFTKTSDNKTNDVSMDFSSIHREDGSKFQYENVLSEKAGHSSSSPKSQLVGLSGSSYVVQSDTSNRLGAEQHKSTSQFVRDMPITELEDLFQARGQHANKLVEESIHVSSEMPGDATVLQSARGSHISHSMSIPGNIVIKENLTGEALTLTSTAGSITQEKDVIMRGPVVFNAAEAITKPGVLTQSLEDNIHMEAGGRIDNSHAGQILARRATAHVTGSTIDNERHDHRYRSVIEAQETFVTATEEDVRNRGGLIQGHKFVQVYAARNVEHVSFDNPEWRGYSGATISYAAEILGGEGTNYSNGYGAVVYAGNGVNVYASTIGSNAHTYIQGETFTKLWTAQTVYRSEDKSWNTGLGEHSHHNIQDESVIWGPATVFGVQNTIYVPEGHVHIHGANLMAPEGTTVECRDQHISESAVATLHRKVDGSKVGFRGKPDEKDRETSRTSVFQTESGPVRIISTEQGIRSTGTLYLGSPVAKPRLLFQARGDIIISPGVLDHSIVYYELLKPNVSIAGQSVYGGQESRNLAQSLSSFDQVAASGQQFTQSRNPLDALINGYSFLGGVNSWANSIAQNGVMGAVAQRTGASVAFTSSETKIKYQTLDTAGIYNFDAVRMHSIDGDVSLGVEVDQVRELQVKATTFQVHGNELDSRMRRKSVTVTSTLSLTGAADVSAQVAYTEEKSKHFAQNTVNVSELSLDVDTFDIAGASVNTNTIEGRANTIETRNLNGYTKTKNVTFSASAAGNVGGSVSSELNETQDAMASLHVKEGINNDPNHQLKVNKHVNHGQQAITTDKPEENKLYETAERKQIDEVLNNKKTGGSVSTNLVAIGDPTKGHMAQVGVNTLDKVDRVAADGIHTEKDEGHNFTLVQYFEGEPELPISKSARQQLESTDYLTSSGYIDPKQAIAQQADEAPQLAPEEPKLTPTINSAQKEKLNEVSNDFKQGRSTAENSQGTKFNFKKHVNETDWTAPDAYAPEQMKRSVDAFLSDPMNSALRNTANKQHKNSSIVPEQAPSSSYQDHSTSSVFFDAIIGDVDAKLEMRNRWPNGAQFFDNYDPDLARNTNDSEFMAEAKMYGRTAKNIRDGVVHLAKNPQEVITGPFVFGADVIEGALHYYGGKPYYPASEQRNMERVDTVVKLWNADGLEQREAILTATGSALLFGGLSKRPAAPLPRDFRGLTVGQFLGREQPVNGRPILTSWQNTERTKTIIPLGRSRISRRIGGDAAHQYSQGNGTNLAYGSGSAVNSSTKYASFEVICDKLGMNQLQKENLISGKQVVLENLELQSGDYTVLLVKKQGETLQVGIHTMFTSDKGGALFKFRGNAKSLAKSLNCKDLQLFGAEIENTKLRQMLLKNGFEPGPNISFDIHGGTTVAPTLRKTFKLSEPDVTITLDRAGI